MILVLFPILFVLTASASVKQQEGDPCSPNDAVFVDVRWARSYFVCHNQRLVREYCLLPFNVFNPVTLQCEYTLFRTVAPYPGTPPTTQSAQI